MTNIKKLKPDNSVELTKDVNTYTYNKGMYYINNSGLLCRMPDQIEAREEIRAEYLENYDGSFRMKG